MTEARPLERRVDTVLRIGPSDGEDFLLAIEAQSGKVEGKEASWAYYVAFLQNKYRLPVLLLIVCHDRATAKWAAGPFDCGTRGWTAQRTHPLVAGPDNLPVITDVRTATKNLPLAALSALAHARGAECEFLETSLGKSPAGEKWKEIMPPVTYFPGRGTMFEKAYLEGKAEGKAEGVAAGEAKGVLSVLEARGIAVSDGVRERITTCTDLDRVDTWLKRSLTVERAEDLFAKNSDGVGADPGQR